MRIKERTLYDISSNKFKYLKMDGTRFTRRVDINELNKRLNENRKSNFYATTLQLFVPNRLNTDTRELHPRIH